MAEVYTKGVDLSRWNGVVDWAKMYAQGVKFAFIKSSQNNFSDTQFAANWKGAKSVSILRAPYHFADYRYRATPQAEYLFETVKAAGGGSDLGYVLDLEQLWQPLPGAAATLAWVREFFKVGDDLFGRPGILYTNPATLRYWLNLTTLLPWLEEHPLWLAHYGVVKPDPRPWRSWTFWQYTSNGDGVAHGCQGRDLDLNWFNGTLEDLLEFAGERTKPEPKPEPTLEEKVARLWNAHPEIH